MNDELDFHTYQVLCRCGRGAVVIKPLDLGDDDKLVCLSLWRHGVGGHRASWRDRLAHIWHIIKHGHPYTDTVLLKPERAHELGSKLHEMAEIMARPRIERPKRKPVASFDHSV